MPPDPTQDVVELRLPLKSEYVNVIRATVGVIAGTLDFTYDEVMQFRVALSEIFELAAHLAEHESADVLGIFRSASSLNRMFETDGTVHMVKYRSIRERT